MFIDASAVVAILVREPGHARFSDRLNEQGRAFYVSAMVRFETVSALARNARQAGRGRIEPSAFAEAERSFELFVAEIGAEEIAITPEIGSAAVAAAARFGKISGHAARLNLGDCFSYACARTLGVPLLYKGDDFSRTDLA